MNKAEKFDDGKLRFDLLPTGPLFEIVKTYTIGVKKYADRNWELGLSWGRVFAGMMRHAFKWFSGEQYDPENGQHHLAAVCWAAMALMEYEHTHPELDDRPDSACAKHFMRNNFDIERGEDATVAFDDHTDDHYEHYEDEFITVSDFINDSKRYQCAEFVNDAPNIRKEWPFDARDDIGRKTLLNRPIRFRRYTRKEPPRESEVRRC